MNDFKSKAEEASARANRAISDAAERLEKESEEFIRYLNSEVVPAVRDKSSKALRIAAEKLARLADYMDEAKKP